MARDPNVQRASVAEDARAVADAGVAVTGAKASVRRGRKVKRAKVKQALRWMASVLAASRAGARAPLGRSMGRIRVSRWRRRSSASRRCGRSTSIDRPAATAIRVRHLRLALRRAKRRLRGDVSRSHRRRRRRVSGNLRHSLPWHRRRRRNRAQWQAAPQPAVTPSQAQEPREWRPAPQPTASEPREWTPTPPTDTTTPRNEP